MTNTQHFKIYKDEKFATEAFKEFRLRKGIICKKCGHTHHYWLESKLQFQCKSCRFRTTLRSGTVLEGSRLPITYFFIAIHLLMKHGNELTTEKFQEISEHKHFDSSWEFLRRMRDYVKHNEQHIMIDFLEVVNYYHVTSNSQISLLKTEIPTD